MHGGYTVINLSFDRRKHYPDGEPELLTCCRNLGGYQLALAALMIFITLWTRDKFHPFCDCFYGYKKYLHTALFHSEQIMMR